MTSIDIDAYGTLCYDDLQALIDAMNGRVGAAELHGMLTAELCTAGIDPDFPAVLQECLQFIGDDIDAAAADRSELQAIVTQTRDGLEDADMSFSMLLPDDDCKIAERAAALADWCQGFMYGFAIAEKKHGLALSQHADIAEILQDFAAISRVEAESTDDQATNEQDLMHLAEYVRVATLNVYAQCVAAGDSTLVGGESFTVH